MHKIKESALKEIFSVHAEMTVAQYEQWFLMATGMWYVLNRSAAFLVYYPGSDVGKG